MNITGAAHEDSKGNKEHVMGNWSQRDPQIATESLPEFCPVLTC